MAVARTHHPVWSGERCLPCGACTRHCPATVFLELAREPDSLRGRVAREYAFPPGKFDIPPCRAACPLSQDVPGYQRAVAAGDFDRALGIVLETNPLPSVCGRLCLSACMHACVRGALDRPAEVRALKRAAASHGRAEHPRPERDRSERVAVIGAGPAGLSAATFLRRFGFGVTLFDAARDAGGLLASAVPAFDLPASALQQDIQAILRTGIELRTGWRLQTEDDIERLFGDGYRAVVLALGAPRVERPGGIAEGWLSVLDFARRFRAGGETLPGALLVAGAGREAVAAARMGIRAGAAVRLLLAGPPGESPVPPAALQRARAEGVEILEGFEVVGAERKGAQWTVRCREQSFEPADPVGRRWPAALKKGRAESFAAETLVLSGERLPDLGWVRAGSAFSATPVGTLRARAEDLMTGRAGVFAAGELVAGERNVVLCIASGRRAAEGVRRYLEGAA
ncbi:MAG: FAD-dependent oxidoreductase [Myxococcales bacterium]|nr:FAD-dependent oxidoreductase [Myxococcales bacterium]